MIRNRCLGHQVIVELALSVLLADGYGARERGVLRRLCIVFKLPWKWFAMTEKIIGQTLLEISTLDHTHKKKKRGIARYAKIGAAAVGAGALLAVTGRILTSPSTSFHSWVGRHMFVCILGHAHVTGGLAAPLIAAGIAALGTTGTATFAALATTTTGTAVIGPRHMLAHVTIVVCASVSTIFGTTGAGLASYKMNRRTQGLTEFAFELQGGEGSLAVCICVGGWLKDRDDYKRAFGTATLHLVTISIIRRVTNACVAIQVSYRRTYLLRSVWRGTTNSTTKPG